MIEPNKTTKSNYVQELEEQIEREKDAIRKKKIKRIILGTITSLVILFLTAYHWKDAIKYLLKALKQGDLMELMKKKFTEGGSFGDISAKYGFGSSKSMNSDAIKNAWKAADSSFSSMTKLSESELQVLITKAVMSEMMGAGLITNAQLLKKQKQLKSGELKVDNEIMKRAILNYNINPAFNV